MPSAGDGGSTGGGNAYVPIMGGCGVAAESDCNGGEPSYEEARDRESEEALDALVVPE